ncbi:MAG: GtrA family protein [Clostridia bacterium]|nr:GtrA family protein [Clostridia bacterium]
MENILKRFFASNSNNILIQFSRYIVAGGIAALADMSIYHIAMQKVGLGYMSAKVISFFAGVIICYFLSRIWVFDNRSDNLLSDFLKFTVVGLVGLGLSIITLYVLVDIGVIYGLFYFLSDSVIKDVANAVTIVVVLLWNFIARRKFVFNLK